MNDPLVLNGHPYSQAEIQRLALLADLVMHDVRSK